MGACATLATTSWGKVSCVCYQPTIFGSLKILLIHRNFHQHWLDDGPVNKLHGETVFISSHCRGGYAFQWQPMDPRL